VIVKVLCDHFESLSPVGNFLAAQQSVTTGEEEQEVAESGKA
jgi:hypothetical protein